jgi:C-terminal processing protease CtpA/Prc
LPDAKSSDTIGVIGYAQKQIFRQGSPIKNVVLDLSCNLGGDADAAIYALSWMLGSSRVHLRDTFTGETTTNAYRCDSNFDRTFDDSDAVSSKRLFCLTSPVSFSCGNLVPCLLKESGKVTMIGQTSGGGACSVFPLSLADGTLFQISGYRQLCTNKNGTYSDIDEGATPDYRIASYADFYRRASLREYLDTLLCA